jgi:aryl-alcohol dehydrogenase-like predicted oxidoreductase
MAQPGITAALASATSVEQLKQLTAAMEVNLTPEQVARLNIASADVVAETA